VWLWFRVCSGDTPQTTQWLDALDNSLAVSNTDYSSCT